MRLSMRAFSNEVEKIAKSEEADLSFFERHPKKILGAATLGAGAGLYALARKGKASPKALRAATGHGSAGGASRPASAHHGHGTSHPGKGSSTGVKPSPSAHKVYKPELKAKSVEQKIEKAKKKVEHLGNGVTIRRGAVKDKTAPENVVRAWHREKGETVARFSDSDTGRYFNKGAPRKHYKK